LKDATEYSEYQETYYRACSYEAIYMFEYIDRQKGVAMSHAIYHHAKDNDSNIGMYFATFTLGTIREQSGNKGLAEKSFNEALNLKKKYLPNESAAPCYLGLCEVALQRKDYEEVQEYARKALDEPGIIPMNKITAWSYKCLARYNQGDSLGFEEAYKERAMLIAEYGGQGGLFGELINVYQAKNRKQWQLALQRTEKLIHQQNKCAQKASIYEHMGDVSGKGVPAALYMAEVTRMFRTLVDGRLLPDKIAERLNNVLVEDNDQGMFVTMFIGLINLKTGRMEYCNAGHNPPLLDGEYMKMESNAPIGLWSEVEYAGEEVGDMHGKTLFVYTDGINEAENIHKEQFGNARLRELLQRDWGDARQTSESIHRAVEDFVGDAEPSDDLTKMCIIMK
jgi:tetratricopeptide (TPR) repeat protein